MAQRINTVLVDDLDESEASETIAFSLDGTSYEIDLNDAHAADLRDAFAPWVGAARKAGRASAANGRRTARAAGARSGGADREKTQEIREWARKKGHQVSERGRLSSAVLEAYEAAH